MRKKRLFISIGLLIIVAVSIIAIVPGLAVAGVSVPDDYNVGRLPDSQIYFMTSLKRTITGYLTFGTQNEAKLALKYANEDILAINKLCDEDKYQVAEKHCHEFLEHFREASRLTVRTKFKDGERDAAILIEAMKQSNIWQRDILTEILEQTPAVIHDSFLETIQSSSSKLGIAIGTIYGADKEKIFMQTLEPIPELAGYQIKQDATEMPADSNNEQTLSEEPIIEKVVDSVGSTKSLEISNLETDDDRVSPGDECHIECNATSADGGNLSYEWSASGGDISGEGASITWTAPNEADKYKITVTVSNEQGEMASDYLKIKVISVDPPEIEEMIVTPYDPQFFVEQPFSKKYVILNGKSCELECILSDDSGYDFEWSTTKGTISGSGSTVVWTAPRGKMLATVTVKVSNGNGDTVKQEILFDIRTCVPCFL